MIQVGMIILLGRKIKKLDEELKLVEQVSEELLKRETERMKEERMKEES